MGLGGGFVLRPSSFFLPIPFIIHIFFGNLSRLRGVNLLLLALGVLGLCGNYIFYLLGLNYLTPSAAQVVVQLAPMFMLLGSMFFFKEVYSPLQWMGFLVLCLGLILFFNQQWEEIFIAQGQYTLGVLLVVLAALVWAGYALAQKQLLNVYSSEVILIFSYFFGILLFLPFSSPLKISSLGGTEVFLLAFCAINTLVAYGCFAEALNHWEASRVSALLSSVPLMTVGIGILLSFFCGVYAPRRTQHPQYCRGGAGGGGFYDQLSGQSKAKRGRRNSSGAR